MVTITLPNPDKVARDMGAWSAVAFIGQAFGSAFGGIVLSLIGKSGADSTSTVDSNDDSNRAPYTRSGYQSIFIPAAAAVLLSGVLLFPVRSSLRPPPAPHGPVDQGTAGRLAVGNNGVESIRSPLLSDE